VLLYWNTQLGAGRTYTVHEVINNGMEFSPPTFYHTTTYLPVASRGVGSFVLRLKKGCNAPKLLFGRS
jgi:hypothetical protein